MNGTFRFIVQTPHATVLDTPVSSVRVLTESGHVGIRSQMEPVVLPIESGLLLVRTNDGVRFLGSAGGLLVGDGHEVTLHTPLAVAGNDSAAVQRELNDTLASPDSELVVRRKLGRLESRILSELRRGPHDGVPRKGGRP